MTVCLLLQSKASKKHSRTLSGERTALGQFASNIRLETAQYCSHPPLRGRGTGMPGVGFVSGDYFSGKFKEIVKFL